MPGAVPYAAEAIEAGFSGGMERRFAGLTVSAGRDSASVPAHALVPRHRQSQKRDVSTSGIASKKLVPRPGLEPGTY